LAERHLIEQHYLMYSRGSYGDVSITDAGRMAFEQAFGKSWDAEVQAGHILGNPQLLKEKGIDEKELYLRWNEQFMNHQTHKIQMGLIMAWLDELGTYCINAFYPAMEANFYYPFTCMNYHVLEFDPQQLSWQTFRKKILGSTDASHADPESFRGQLFREFPVEFPSRDNFVHGSAGPLEGLIERMIHEPDFSCKENPVGQYLLNRGISCEAFEQWKVRQTLDELGTLFDQTEEKNTAEIFPLLQELSCI
jgi:hypothetical protein